MEVYLNSPAGEPLDGKLDLITFNFGLHDLGNKTTDISTYESQLSMIAQRPLTAVSNDPAKLLYLLTTPMMPDCCDGGPLIPSSEGAPPPKCKSGAAAVYPCDSVVARLNAAATRVMATHNIPIVDLHTVVTDVCAPEAPHTYVNCSICRMAPCSFHYTPDGYDVIAKPIADRIRAVLSSVGAAETKEGYPAAARARARDGA
jgi:hypothetical protein